MTHQGHAGPGRSSEQNRDYPILGGRVNMVISTIRLCVLPPRRGAVAATFRRAREPPSSNGGGGQGCMLNEDYISKVVVWAAFFWGVAFALMVATVMLKVMGLVDAGWIGILTTAALLAGMAGSVGQVRYYTCRLAALIRATAGLDNGQGPPDNLRVIR